MDNTGKVRVIVTGHNKESSGRVIHYLRPVGPASGDIEFHGGVIIGDEKTKYEDDEEFDVTLSFKKVPKSK